MTSTSHSGQQHWYLKFFVHPLLLALRSIVALPHQLLPSVPLPSGAQHRYVRFVFNPLLWLLQSSVIFFIRILGLVSYALQACGQILILLQRFIIKPLLRSPYFIMVFTSQLLKFNPNQLTPGRYALETVGKWPGRLIAFSPALFRFSVHWGQKRPRFLNRITLLAPVSASLFLFSPTILKASFLSSFLALHFPEDLNVEVIKLPFL